MRTANQMITVGLSPAWDITCRGRNLDWDLHQYIDEQVVHPAGKALNVSKALAWMGHRSVAAGLWGRDDYQQMKASVRRMWPLVTLCMTEVPGCTRQNVTVVDTAANKDMHLRDRSELVSTGALKKLRTDLDKVVRKGSICVFAGTMPEGTVLTETMRLVEFCRDRGARIALDTSGEALRRIIDAGTVWLVKPNVEELRELLDEPIKDSPSSLAGAGRRLLDRVGIVLISRGAKGSVVVTKDEAWQSRCLDRRKLMSTVGCGDCLLAGFLKSLRDESDLGSALKDATKVAGSKAWGWMETRTWLQVKRRIRVDAGPL